MSRRPLVRLVPSEKYLDDAQDLLDQSEPAAAAHRALMRRLVTDFYDRDGRIYRSEQIDAEHYLAVTAEVVIYPTIDVQIELRGIRIRKLGVDVF